MRRNFTRINLNTKVKFIKVVTPTRYVPSSQVPGHHEGLVSFLPEIILIL